MIKGFIFFKDDKIPFTIDRFCMELFSDEAILENFNHEYRDRINFVLYGQCFCDGYFKRFATFFVEKFLCNTCYLKCYIVYNSETSKEYDAIGLQSPFLDDIFRYQYNYIDMVRKGVNFSIKPVKVYSVPFSLNNNQYNLSYNIGYNSNLGILEDYDKNGEILISLQSKTIQECLDISVALYRLAMFMSSRSKVPYKKIVMYHKGYKVGWLCCDLVSENSASANGISFYEFDVEKYVPKILNNIALDCSKKITKSIPLGHLGDINSLFSPRRFIEQIEAFEYLFDKIDHKKAQDKRFPLKKELTYAFNLFPRLFSYNNNISIENISEGIKSIRRDITHGYTYYYDFDANSKECYYIILLDKLIKALSLKWIGFSEEDINNYKIW